MPPPGRGFGGGFRGRGGGDRGGRGGRGGGRGGSRGGFGMGSTLDLRQYADKNRRW